MKKANGFIVLITLAFALSGCNNYFHDLIPPDENRIISFSVEGIIDRAIILDNTVDANVNNTSPLSSLTPVIEVSPKATLLPLTYAYLSAAFPNIDILQESAAVYEAHDLSEYVMDLIKRNPDFSVPLLDMPIDFSGPVTFLVISGQGTIRQYTVHVVKDTGEPRILGFSFSKYDNPELIRDASSAVNANAKTVNVGVLYPMEMYVSYVLIPSFEIFGERLEVDGAAIQSGIDTIQFDHVLGTQTKTLTVWRNGMSADYILTAEFTEDPDSIRSIIDFRFYKAGNPGIAATAVGSIMNNNAVGTINVQVFYAGTRPSVLTPAFLSPGTVSVAGVTQISGSTGHDFSQALEYRVVSRNNLYTRTYTVVIDLIDIASAAPVFTLFKFSSGINPELVQDTESQISDSASLIMITARYGGSYAPEMLIPEFRATGLVTVYGSVQTSGMSAQNFSTQIKYTVTDPVNTLFKRDYWVQVTFIRDTSSGASINSFSFHPDENPGLADEVEGRIDHNAGTITLFAPIGSGVTARTMIPRFRATGQVLVEGDVQISGTSGRLFDTPIVYEVVSANGINRKAYTVTVRELQTTIFVNHVAYGEGDGASWQDAFRELSAACEAAALFPDDVPKEIWIAAGTYKPSASGNCDEYLLLAANTSYIGGFAGYETAKSQRNVAANRVAISGDLGGGVYSANLFGSFNGTTSQTVNGDVSFEELEFTAANATAATDDRKNGAAICAALSSGSELRITDCDFNNLQANEGGAVYINGGKLVIADITIGSSSAAINGTGLSGVEINDIELHTITGDGFAFPNCSGDITIDSVSMQDISGRGISVNAGGSPVRISQTTVKNISGGDGISTNGGTTVIENVVVENVTNGTGMMLEYSGSVRVSGSTIKDVQAPSGSGVSLSGTGNAVISDITIENINVVDGTAIFANINGDLIISDSTVNMVISSYGLNLIGLGNTVISNTAIGNINAGSSGYVIYVSNRGLVIADTTINNSAAQHGIYGTDLTSVDISDLALQDIGYGLFFTNCSGDVEINRVNLQNLSMRGIYITGGNGKKELANITGYNINSYGVYVGSGGGNITLAESRFDNVGQIYLYNNSASINISDTTIKDVSGTNAIGTGSGNIIIERVNIESVSGRGIEMNASGTGQITGSSIKNCKTTGIGGGIYLTGSGSVVISNTLIDNIEASSGGGIYGGTGTTQMSLSNSTITNATVTSNGGGIYYGGTGNLVISGTTIENVVATGSGGGGGIYGGSNVSQINLSNTIIKNSRAGYGGGIYYGGTGSLVISGTNSGSRSRFENCRANNRGGAIYTGGTEEKRVVYEITNTTFLNCTAGNGSKFIGFYSSSTFKGCIFEDNDDLYKYDLLTGYIYPMFGRYGGYFEDCTFTNLTDIFTGMMNGSTFFAEKYIFTNSAQTNANTTWGTDIDLTLKDCTFNFRAGSAGLLSNYFGDLLMDGVTINNNGCQQTLLWLKTNNAINHGNFQFKLNNVYNGTLLNTQAAILGLASGGIMRLTPQGGPILVIVP